MARVKPTLDPYRVLGVLRGATPLQIKAAHRKLAKRYHPDGSTGDELRFLAVQEAYQLLSDPERRGELSRACQQAALVELLTGTLNEQRDQRLAGSQNEHDEQGPGRNGAPLDVRMRMHSDSSMTRILPSPIWPVWAPSIMASIVFWT